jgi:hypothetical protein
MVLLALLLMLLATWLLRLLLWRLHAKVMWRSKHVATC